MRMQKPASQTSNKLSHLEIFSCFTWCHMYNYMRIASLAQLVEHLICKSAGGYNLQHSATTDNRITATFGGFLFVRLIEDYRELLREMSLICPWNCDGVSVVFSIGLWGCMRKIFLGQTGDN